MLIAYASFVAFDLETHGRKHASNWSIKRVLYLKFRSELVWFGLVDSFSERGFRGKIHLFETTISKDRATTQ